MKTHLRHAVTHFTGLSRRRRWAVAGASCGAAGFALLGWLTIGLPSLDEIKPLDISRAISVLARDGSLIARFGNTKAENAHLSDLPPWVGQAVLAIEDRRFYHHPGIDVIGLSRAMIANLQAGRWVQGGSTLTQQLAKNLFLSPDKTLRRKGQEALMAIYVESRFTKDEILEAYLNRVYFGAGAYGVEAAARAHFSKRARDLTLWESAVLAGLLKAPSRYSPHSNPVLAAARAQTVLSTMVEAGYITEEQEKKAVKAGRSMASGARKAQGRYFPDWVLSQLDEFIGDPFAGASGEGDIEVRTTLEPRMQVVAEKAMRDTLDAIVPEEKVSQGALVTLAKDGAVLAMVGGRDYAQTQFNRAAQALRQPGSSFKPFIYLAAIESGYGPGDMILDAKIEDGSYRPDNYEGQYYGEVTLADALAFSMNTAAIRLLSAVGVPHLLDVARRAGLPDTLRPELATGLGASEVTLLDMTGAYATISNGGYQARPYGVLSVKDAKGHVLYARAPQDQPRVFSPRDLSLLDGMLEQVVLRGTGMAAQTGGLRVAGKTGTTQNYRDAWFIGYTDSLVTGIWMGNDDDTPMRKVSGGRYPARLWRDYMAVASSVPLPPGARSWRGAGIPDMAGEGEDGESRGFFFFGGSRPSFNFGGVKPSQKPVYNN